MPVMYVDTESLNLRSAPTSQEDNIIGKLYLTQKVEVGDQLADGWIECNAFVAGQNREGFVASRYLRRQLSENRERLIASVRDEYLRFKRGLGQEHIAPFSGFVGEMWQAIGFNLDGTDREQPWSAAAISFMVRNGGNAYDRFRFSAGHSKFIFDAIRARNEQDTTKPFWGYRLHEVRPEIGDIVGKDNPEEEPVVDYDVAERMESYRSHSDVIVSIDSANNKLLTIGGNVNHSVGVSTYDLAPGDFLAPTGHTFVILKNVTDGPPAII